jgi:hypothetical protein
VGRVVHELWTAAVDDGDDGITRQVDVVAPCGQRPRRPAAPDRLPGVSDVIEVPPAEVYALAGRLGDQSGLAAEVAARLGTPPAVGGPLQPALVEFLFCHRTAAHALAGELDWLGSTLAAVVDSWLGLDRGVLGSTGRAVPR